MPYPVQSYSPIPFADRSTTLLDLLLKGGQAQADAVRQRGELAAHLWSTLGQQASQAIGAQQQYSREAPLRQAQLENIQAQREDRLANAAARTAAADEKRTLSKQAQALSDLIENNPNPTVRDFTKIAGPDKGPKLYTDWFTAKNLQATTDAARQKEQLSEATGQLDKTPVGAPIPAGQFAADVTAGIPTGRFAYGSAGSVPTIRNGQSDAQLPPMVTNAGTPEQIRAQQTADRLQAAEDAKTPKGPEVGSLADYLLQQYGPRPTAAQIAEGRTKYESFKPPSAQIQILNATNAATQNLPDWATDASRPSGAEGNKIHPVLKMTPNGLFQDAKTWIDTGQYPPMSRGSDPVSQIKRMAIDSKVGAIAADAQMDVPTLRAFYRANSKSLAQQQQFADAAQSFLSTADKNSDLLAATLKKIPDTGIPVFNQPLRAFSKSVAGDKNLSQFSTYLQSIQNEYAKILTQPNLAGQLTDSARQEASQLIRSDATVGQILGSVQALRAEGGNRLTSIGEQIQRISGRMQNGTSAQPAVATPAPVTAGKIIVTAPDGSVQPFDTQAQADRFKQLAGIR